MVVEWSCWCFKNPANHLRLVVHPMICRGFLVGTGISEPSTVPVQQKRVRFLMFSHLRCHLSQFGFQGITTGVDFQLPGQRAVSGRKNSPGFDGKTTMSGRNKKKLNKVFRNFNNPFLFWIKRDLRSSHGLICLPYLLVWLALIRCIYFRFLSSPSHLICLSPSKRNWCSRICCLIRTFHVLNPRAVLSFCAKGGCHCGKGKPLYSLIVL